MSRCHQEWHSEDNIVVGLEWDHGAPFVHLSLAKWSPSIGKRLLELLALLQKQLHEAGHRYLFAYNLHQDDKWEKFMKFMGFEEGFLHNGLKVYYVSTNVWDLIRSH